MTGLNKALSNNIRNNSNNTLSNHHLQYDYLLNEDYALINEAFQGSDSLAVIKWAFEQFEESLVYACSFGAEAMVLLDLISKVREQAHIVFLDTNLHFQQTYTLIEQIQKKYPSFTIELVQPDLSLQEQEAQYGSKLWEKNPDACCHLRKIEPLQKVLSTKKAWLSGLRRQQSPSRAHTQYVNKDTRFQKIKICPLIHWSWDEIWQYIHTHQLPYNPLHDQGYPSIGCEKCTFPVEDGTHTRAGRWVTHNKTECGLHNEKEWRR